MCRVTDLVASLDSTVVDAIRRGDEEAFTRVVERLQPLLRRMARHWVRSEADVGDVLQETWIGVLHGIDRFEGRCTLRTWVVSILVNVARTHAVKEARTVPVAMGMPTDGAACGFDPGRFQGADGQYPGHWTTSPTPWDEDPFASASARETYGLVSEAVAALPHAQRVVISLRDVEGWTGPEVARALGISAGNQRVLLHRARAKVRLSLDPHLVAPGGGRRASGVGRRASVRLDPPTTATGVGARILFCAPEA